MQGKRKPKLGQNFLSDDTARHRIANALGDISARTVLEVGPGHGAITSILAAHAQKLLCVELDRSLAAELRFRYRDQPSVEIVEADILTINLAEIAGDTQLDVVGNLPYYITSDILLHLFAAAAHLRVAIVMMQREVAERVAATPGSRDYGLLSTTAQLYARIENLFTLPPAAFTPPPEVDSTVLRLHFAPRFEELGIADPARFIALLKASFAQKRKTLSNNLRAAGYTPDAIAHACEAAAISPQTRAEAMPLETFAALYKALN